MNDLPATQPEEPGRRPNRGRRKAQRMERFDDIFFEALSEEQFRAIALATVQAAAAGNEWAIKEVLNRSMGRVPVSPSAVVEDDLKQQMLSQVRDMSDDQLNQVRARYIQATVTAGVISGPIQGGQDEASQPQGAIEGRLGEDGVREPVIPREASNDVTPHRGDYDDGVAPD